jgi:uncharacterized protein YlxW (UPF0749 family)
MKELDPYSIEASSYGGGATVVQIDIGKHFFAIIVMSIICGVSAAVAVGTVWHSKDREVATEAQYRKTQNHVDEMTNELKRLKDRLEDYENATRR